MPLDGLVSARTRSRLCRVLADPAVHFLALGALVFAVERLCLPSSPERSLVVSAAFIEGLRQEHRSRTGRSPSVEQEQESIDRFVDEELLYREAVALGLDRGDVIVRRRLAQKMEFVLGDTAAAPPTDAAIAAYALAHRDRYTEPARVSFRHVFVSRSRGATLDEDATKLLDRLRAGADPATMGDPFVDGAEQVGRSSGDLASRFGDPFAGEVMACAVDTWSGPVRSSYGLHLVRVTERTAERMPPIAQLRERVLREMDEERRKDAARDARRRLRERYRVVIEQSRDATHGGAR